MNKMGGWAFIVGIALAIFAALIPTLQNQKWAGWVLIILGLIVGLLNITAKETQEFLIATIALMMTNSLAMLFGGIIGQAVTNIVIFVAPAALVVALKVIWELAEE